MITAFFVFALGASMGSFSSALIYRARTGETIVRGRSRCPSCGHVLGIRDLVPLLSWVALRGRCRYCRASVSWQYLGLEAACGALFLAAYFAAGAPLPEAISQEWIGFLRIALFSVFLTLVFVYDARYGEIPDHFSVTGTVVALAVNVSLHPREWFWYLAAAAAGAAFFGIQWAVSRGKWVGDGDIFLGAMLGAMLGWPLAIFGIFGGYLIGSVAVAVLLLAGKKRMTDCIPLGPFLALGTAVVLMLPPDFFARFWYGLVF